MNEFRVYQFLCHFNKAKKIYYLVTGLILFGLHYFLFLHVKVMHFYTIKQDIQHIQKKLLNIAHKNDKGLSTDNILAGRKKNKQDLSLFSKSQFDAVEEVMISVKQARLNTYQFDQALKYNKRDMHQGTLHLSLYGDFYSIIQWIDKFLPVFCEAKVLMLERLSN